MYKCIVTKILFHNILDVGMEKGQKQDTRERLERNLICLKSVLLENKSVYLFLHSTFPLVLSEPVCGMQEWVNRFIFKQNRFQANQIPFQALSGILFLCFFHPYI